MQNASTQVRINHETLKTLFWNAFTCEINHFLIWSGQSDQTLDTEALICLLGPPKSSRRHEIRGRDAAVSHNDVWVRDKHVCDSSPFGILIIFGFLFFKLNSQAVGTTRVFVVSKYRHTCVGIQLTVICTEDDSTATSCPRFCCLAELLICRGHIRVDKNKTVSQTSEQKCDATNIVNLSFGLWQRLPNCHRYSCHGRSTDMVKKPDVQLFWSWLILFIYLLPD